MSKRKKSTIFVKIKPQDRKALARVAQAAQPIAEAERAQSQDGDDRILLQIGRHVGDRQQDLDAGARRQIGQPRQNAKAEDAQGGGNGGAL
jgi:acyl-CoA reductase-like NAD-dependent aldehyde dehydrogenase